jgi:A/G-specific adenine glycosylase
LKKLIIKGMDNRYFSSKIVSWYLENKRDLPWRRAKDAYKIWLSEIILQQTRVLQGLPYYERFVKTYPTIQELAKAPEQDILRLWQGLGYYTRARNLHKCAKFICEHLHGKFPETFDELRKLPGIGDYTAAAVASFANKECVAVVDGNVFRVLARVYGINEPINSPEGRKTFTTLANQLIDDLSPDIYNQAIMEFGAMFCTPKNPSCENCIFSNICFARTQGMQQSLPVKIKRTKVRKRYFHYVVLRKGNSLLMKKRIDKDIWIGLYDFPLIEKSKPHNIQKLLQTELPWLKKMLKGRPQIQVSTPYKHVLTHQTIFCRFVVIDHKSVPQLEKPMKFYSLKQISALPKPVLISRFLEQLDFHS